MICACLVGRWLVTLIRETPRTDARGGLSAMQRAKSLLKWDRHSEIVKTVIVLVMVAGVTFGGYGVFMVAMGTTTPLVVVTSESMVPYLNIGDMLVLQHRPQDQIHLSDVVVYRADWYTAAPVVHRIVQIDIIGEEYRYYTKGDANLAQDPGYRLYEDIIGVVALLIPKLGHVSLFLQTTEGRILMIGLFIAIIVLPEFVCKKESENKEVPSKDSDSKPADAQ